MSLSKKYSYIFLIAFGLSACTTGINLSEEKAARKYELGMSLLKEGKSPQSISQLTEAERLSPKNLSIKNGLSLAYLARGRADLALNKIEQALQIDRTYTEALITKAQILFSQSKYKDSLVSLDLAAKDLTFSSPSVIWELKSEAHLKLNQKELAQKSIQEAIRLSPQSCSNRAKNGIIFYDRRLFSQAVSSLTETGRMCGAKTPEVQYYLALSQYHIGNKNRAIEILSDLMKTNDFDYKEKAESALNVMRE